MTSRDPWEAEAKCAVDRVDPDLFFVGRSDPSGPPTAAQAQSIKLAKQVCNGSHPSVTTVGYEAEADDESPCPVRMQCLERALTAREKFGVWGGMSHRERENYRKAVQGT